MSGMVGWASPVARTLRAAVFAGVCVSLAAAAHLSMSPGTIPPRVLALAFTSSAVATWTLAARRRGPLAFCSWMLVVQGALHLLFTRTEQLLATTATAMPAMSMPGSAGSLGSAAGRDWSGLLLGVPAGAHPGIGAAQLVQLAGFDPSAMPGIAGMSGMAGMPGMSATVAVPGMPGMAGGTGVFGALGMSAGMLAAHALAALCCALLLWRGEQAVHGLLDLLRVLAFRSPLLALLLLLFGPVPPVARPRGGHPPHRRPRPRLVLLSHVLVRRGPPLPLPVV
jgi:hypothetical protein